MSTVDTVVGLDLGTTTAKALIRPLGSDVALVSECATPWTTTPDGSEISANALLSLAVELIGRSVRNAERHWGPVRVRAVSVTGLAESGVVVGPDGRTEMPAISWFDRRGHSELIELAEHEPDLCSAFSGATGLPWSAQASFAKLLWLQRIRPIVAGSRWLSIPEWIVRGLGGDFVREPSLASRTGLIRQSTGTPWNDAMVAAGVTASLLPDAMPAGSRAGRLRHADLPTAVQGAVLSVAGHDHPVAALAVDAVGADELFNSSGTADVLARAVASPLSDAQRTAVVAAGWSAGAHVVPGIDLLLAGASGGLLLRRVLTALGAVGGEARDRLDAASTTVTSLPAGLIVRGDGRNQDDVEIRLRDGAGPPEIWAAAIAYATGLTAAMLADIEPVVGAHRRAVAAGGWTRLAGVRAAKRRALGELHFSDLPEPGAAGAALLAEYSLDAGGRPLQEYLPDLRRRTASAPNPDRALETEGHR